MAREITAKPANPYIKDVLDHTGKTVRASVPAYRACDGTATESAELVLRVNGADVMNIGPVVLPAAKSGKRCAVGISMRITDSAEALVDLAPPNLPVEDR